MNATASCASCAGLGSTCGTLCAGYGYFPSSNSSNASISTCLPCDASYGIGCSSCSSTVCTGCSGTLKLAGNSLSCVDAACGIDKCAQCAGSSSCFLCQTGYIWDTTTSKCISSSCSVNYCGLCNGVICAICSPGYSIANGGKTCAPKCDWNCNNCISPGVCGSCIHGYVINTQTMACAIDCSIGFEGLCASCTNLLFCTTCKTGYVPAFFGLLCVK